MSKKSKPFSHVKAIVETVVKTAHTVETAFNDNAGATIPCIRQCVINALCGSGWSTENVCRDEHNNDIFIVDVLNWTRGSRKIKVCLEQ